MLCQVKDVSSQYWRPVADSDCAGGNKSSCAWRGALQSVHRENAAGNVMLTDSWSTATASLINTPPHSCDDNDNGLIKRPDSSVKINIITEGVAAYQGLTITAASDSLQMRFLRLWLRSAETQEFVGS